MKITKFLAAALSLILVGSVCSCSPKNEADAKVLLCYAGDSNDEFGGGVYSAAKDEAKCGFKTLELGKNADNYRRAVEEEIAKGGIETVAIVGRDAYNGLSGYVKSFKGMNFIVLDAALSEVRENVCALEFQPEEYGYLGGRAIAESGAKKAGYVSVYENGFDNRVLYGFLQGVGNASVSVKYIEEQTNVVKAEDYASSAYQNGVTAIFETSGRSALGSLDAAKKNGGTIYFGGVNLKKAAKESRDDATLETVRGGIEKNYAEAMNTIRDMAKNGFKTGTTKYLSAKDDAFICDLSAENVKYLSDNPQDFKRLSDEKIAKDDSSYTPKHSVDSAYHEAVPSCADTNDWKYHPRAGSGNGNKPLGWKGVGIWSTIYLQNGQNPVSNTGIEFQNMKIWAYTKSSGWVLLEHANPKGSFYDENFGNDAHKNFMSNSINYAEEKRTRIKLDYATLGYNYHPFGSQIDLVEMGLLNADGSVKNNETLYILSEMDIRLCVWDASQPSDIDEAKYVANIGADWWREKGLQWTPDWNSNKDVCVGQFRTITQDWKRLYMTNVPSAIYEEIFKDFPFNQ